MRMLYVDIPGDIDMKGHATFPLRSQVQGDSPITYTDRPNNRIAIPEYILRCGFKYDNWSMLMCSLHSWETLTDEAGVSIETTFPTVNPF